MKNLALLSAAHTHTRGYVNNINERDDCRLVSLWDDIEDRGRRYSEEYGADYSADLNSVVERVDVDGFIICAENTGHLPLLEAAIPVYGDVDDSGSALALTDGLLIIRFLAGFTGAALVADATAGPRSDPADIAAFLDPLLAPPGHTFRSHGLRG